MYDVSRRDASEWHRFHTHNTSRRVRLRHTNIIVTILNVWNRYLSDAWRQDVSDKCKSGLRILSPKKHTVVTICIIAKHLHESNISLLGNNLYRHYEFCSKNLLNSSEFYEIKENVEVIKICYIINWQTSNNSSLTSLGMWQWQAWQATTNDRVTGALAPIRIYCRYARRWTIPHEFEF